MDSIVRENPRFSSIQHYIEDMSVEEFLEFSEDQLIKIADIKDRMPLIVLSKMTRKMVKDDQIKRERDEVRALRQKIKELEKEKDDEPDSKTK